MNSVASMLRTSRASAGLTQAALAKRASTSQPALARYETGVALPTLPTLERLLSACGKHLKIRAVPAIGPATPGLSLRGQLSPRAREIHKHRRRLLDAADRHGARKLRVFGSVARGEDVPASDVDLLVELGPGRTLLDLVAFRRQAEEILGMSVDVATPDMLKQRIRSEVEAEAMPL